jgi:cytochrome c biogenesis protein CcdA
MYNHRNKLNYSELLGYIVAFITMGGGFVILINMLKFQIVPFVRYTFGIVIILVGVHRFVITRLKYRVDIKEMTGKIMDDEDE